MFHLKCQLNGCWTEDFLDVGGDDEDVTTFGFGVGSSRAAAGPTAGFLNHSF